MVKIKFVLLLILFSAARDIFSNNSNLLPSISIQKGPGLHWETVRTAESYCEFGVDKNVKFEGSEGSLYIKKFNKSSYSEWRIQNPYIKLEPEEEYIFSIWVKNNTEEEAPYLEVYSFGKGGKPTRIAYEVGKLGITGWYKIEAEFKIPFDSEGIRIGLGIKDTEGDVWFCGPLLKKKEKGVKMTEKKYEVVPQWIWLKDDPGVSKAIFRKDVVVKKKPIKALIEITADDMYEIYINGMKIGEDSEWKTPEIYDTTQNFKEGINRIEVRVTNLTGPGGLLLKGGIFYEDGSYEFIKTDETWSVEIPELKKKGDLWVIGEVGCHPWGEIYLPDMEYKVETIKGKIVRYTEKINQGDVFKIVLEIEKVLEKEDMNSVKINFCDSKNRKRTVSSVSPRVTFSNQKLSIELPISTFAPPDIYRVDFEMRKGKVIVIEGSELKVEIQENKILSKSPLPTSILACGNKIKISGIEQSPFIYNTASPSLSKYINWQITNGHIYEVYCPFGAFLNSSGQWEINELEKQILWILEADDKANIIIWLRYDMPMWWLRKNPDEVYISNKGRSGFQSFASDKWRKDSIEYTKILIDELRNQPYGKFIKGVVISAFKGAEFQLWGEAEGEYDCSVVARKLFRQYQRQNGVSEEEIVDLPNPALEFPFPKDEKSQKIRDLFFKFVAERQAENIIYLSKGIKDIYGKDFWVAVYYGYVFEHSSDIRRLLFSGHLGISKVIKEAPIDILTCPASYGLRRLNQPHGFMYPVDSAVLHRIIPVVEDDIRNYMTPYEADTSGPKLPDVESSFLSMRKLRYLAASHGAGVKYHALLSDVDFFQDYPVLFEIRNLNNEVMELKPKKLGGKGQIAVVVDPLEYTKATALSDYTLTKKFLSEIRDILPRTGREVVYIIMDDYLERINLWDIVVIPLPGLISEEKIKIIEKGWGKIPQIGKDTGCLILTSEGKYLCNELTEVWEILKIKNDKNIVYKGENFEIIFDGEKFLKKEIF